MSHVLSNLASSFKNLSHTDPVVNLIRGKGLSSFNPRDNFQTLRTAAHQSLGIPGAVNYASGPLAKFGSTVAPIAGSIVGGYFGPLGSAAGGALGGYLSAPEGNISRNTLIGGAGGLVGGLAGKYLGGAGGAGAATDATGVGGLEIPAGTAASGAGPASVLGGSAGAGSTGAIDAGLPVTAAGADAASGAASGAGSPFGTGAPQGSTGGIPVPVSSAQTQSLLADTNPTAPGTAPPAAGSSVATATADPTSPGYVMPGAQAADTGAPGTGAGGPSFLQRAGTFAKGLVPDALGGTGTKGLGGLVLPAALASSLVLGNRKIPQSGALGADQALQGPALANMASAQAGNISPSQQAQVDQWTKQQKEQVKQYLATSGQGADSTAAVQMLANVDAQALAMKQGFADQMFNESMQQLGVSDSATQALINLQLQQQQNTSQALSQFMLAYGLLNGAGTRAAA
jgi:hypothetical protein